MWATSLKVAVFISSACVEVPDFSQILSSIRGAHAIAKREKEIHSSCVESQLDRCNHNFQSRALSEVTRCNLMERMNARVIAEAEKLQSACFASYSQLHRSLENWVDGDSSISYQEGTASCKTSDRDKLSVLVGDLSAVRSEAYSISEDYSEENQHTVFRIIEYAEARSLYDQQYVENLTSIVGLVVNDFLTAIDVPLLDTSSAFSDLSVDTDNLVSCISVRGTDEGNCDYVDGARGQLDDIMQVVNLRIAYLLNEFDSFTINAAQYKENSLAAYANAMKFYNGW